QMARPPHTESTSTPNERAACRSGVPRGKRPRLPDGVKTTSASGVSADTAAMASLAPPACGTFAGGRSRGPLRRRLAEPADPTHAVRIVAHHDVRAHDGPNDLGMQRVHDRG